MSDNRTPGGDDTDPIDVAYIEAEAVLGDETTLADRRATVLAAIAREGARAGSPGTAPPAVPRRANRRLAGWRPAGWASAACAAGLGIFVALKIYPFVRPQTETAPARSQAPPVSGPAPAPPTSPTGGSLRLVPSENTIVSHKASTTRSTTRRESGSAQPLRAVPSAESRRRASLAPPPVAIPPAPLPLPPVHAPIPETIAPPAPVAPPAPPPYPAPDASAQSARADVERRIQAFPVSPSPESSMARPDLGGALRYAAAAGQAADVLALLDAGAPVDAADSNGDTALMKSLKADRPQVAALLYQRGASRDRRNRLGESATDIVAHGDAELRHAIGLSP